MQLVINQKIQKINRRETCVILEQLKAFDHQVDEYEPKNNETKALCAIKNSVE
jgi:hypothetical protein